MPTPLSFGIFQVLVPGGTTGGSWRHPDNRSVDFLDLDHWVSLARKFEAAKIDFLFFADGHGYPMADGALNEIAVREALVFPQADPVVLVTAVAAATSQLGIVATSSTTVERPQALARRFATLDNFARGRVGWNMVTGASQVSAARLYGEDPIPHDLRYDLAEDYAELTLKLWEGTWEEGALRVDKPGAVYADPAKVHEIHHEGPYFRAHGTLTVPPSPQRAPVLFQAGSSAKGKRFAARFAEAVFLAGGDPVYVGQTIADIKRIAREEGRADGSIKFLVGAGFITGPTEEDAQRTREEILALSTIEVAAAFYHYFTGIDLLALDLDAPLHGATTEQGRGNVDRFTDGAGGAATPRQILEDFRRNGANGTTFVGSPTSIADQVEEFVAVSGADGFLIQPYITPSTYDDFIDLVLPELRRRGLAKTEYAGDTLREHLFGEGQRHLPEDHPGAALRAGRPHA